MFSPVALFETDHGAVLKLGPATVLSSKFRHRGYGHLCLASLEEDAIDSPTLPKFRWMVETCGAMDDTFMISNSGIDGKLFVSDYFFESNGMFIRSVYIRQIDHQDVLDHDVLDRRYLWRFEEREDNVTVLVSAFNGHVLCRSVETANSKGDFWVGVADDGVCKEIHDKSVSEGSLGKQSDDGKPVGDQFVEDMEVDAPFVHEQGVGDAPVGDEPIPPGGQDLGDGEPVDKWPMSEQSFVCGMDVEVPPIGDEEEEEFTDDEEFDGWRFDPPVCRSLL